MSDLAHVTVRDEGRIRVAVVVGEVDASNAPEIKRNLIAALRNAALGMAIDMTKLEYLDSSGIALTFEVAERLRARGQRLVLVVPDDSVLRRTLEVTQTHLVAPLVTTLAEATEEIERGAAA